MSKVIGSGYDKTGRKIEIRWDTNTEKPNRGFICHMATAWTENNECLGFLRVAYIDKNEYKRLVPTIWHHAQAFSGLCLGLESEDEPKKFTGERAKEFCERVNQYLFSWGTQPAETVAELEMRVKKNPKYKRLMENKKKSLNYHLMTPYVDYADVSGRNRMQLGITDQRGAGVGKLLYYGTSVALEDMGLPFFSSTLQSPEAEGIWKKFEEMGMLTPHEVGS